MSGEPNDFATLLHRARESKWANEKSGKDMKLSKFPGFHSIFLSLCARVNAFSLSFSNLNLNFCYFEDDNSLDYCWSLMVELILNLYIFPVSRSRARRMIDFNGFVFEDSLR